MAMIKSAKVAAIAAAAIYGYLLISSPDRLITTKKELGAIDSIRLAVQGSNSFWNDQIKRARAGIKSDEKWLSDTIESDRQAAAFDSRMLREEQADCNKTNTCLTQSDRMRIKADRLDELQYQREFYDSIRQEIERKLLALEFAQKQLQ
jgi:hypothetical protein